MLSLGAELTSSFRGLYLFCLLIVKMSFVASYELLIFRQQKFVSQGHRQLHRLENTVEFGPVFIFHQTTLVLIHS